MKSVHKSLFAIMAVAIMFLGAIAVTFHAEESDADFGPKKYYKYVMSYSNEEITKVEVYDSTGLVKTITAQNTMDVFWKFDEATGFGPFNSCYAAVEASTGKVAFILNPGDLTKDINGNDYTMGNYNIVWLIPTVYWSATDTALTLSSDPNEGTAYAHTIGNTVWKYIGIGVYEASTATVGSTANCLMSQSGKSPTVSQTIVNFDDYAHYTPGNTILWNFYQWTFTKMATYMVGMGKNTQQIWGKGNVNSTGPSQTGLGDQAGAYASFDTSLASNPYSKVFIENNWGSVFEWVGDAVVNNREFYAGQNESGAIYYNTGGKTELSSLPSTNAWINATSKNSADWDLPTGSTSDDNSANTDYPGDFIGMADDLQVMRVGGHYAEENGMHAGIADFNSGCTSGQPKENTGGRLAYFLDLADITVKSNDTNYGTVSPQFIYVNTGSDVTVNGNKITYGTGASAQTVTATPASSSYKFLGWKTADGFLTPSSALTITEDKTFTAVFGPSDSYVYVMNYTGEKIDSVDVYKGTFNHVTDAKNSIWNFNDTTGIGPFNSYYAAVKASTGTPELILKPNDLTNCVS